MSPVGRVLLRVSEFRHVPVDPAEVYFLEAVGEHTMVRLRSKKRLRDLRRLGALLKDFAPYGFVRVHRNHAVNLAHIGEIRQRKGRQDESSSSSLPSIAYSPSAASNQGNC